MENNLPYIAQDIEKAKHLSTLPVSPLPSMIEHEKSTMVVPIIRA
jgi:hypothetical protein